jgi:hypothetical protein
LQRAPFQTKKTPSEKAALEKKREVEAKAARAYYEAAKTPEREETARLKAPRLAQKSGGGDRRRWCDRSLNRHIRTGRWLLAARRGGSPLRSDSSAFERHRDYILDRMKQ